MKVFKYVGLFVLTAHPSKDDGPSGSEGVLISVPGETTAANPYRNEFAVLSAALAADAKAGEVKGRGE